VKLPVVRLAAVLATLAVAGCGGAEQGAPAPDPERTLDLVPLTTAQATRKADRIVIATSGASKVIEGMPGTPFTRTTFVTERVLKGRLQHRFVIQTIGGRLGDVVVDSPVPAFVPRHRYLLFLGPDGPAGPTIFPQAVRDLTRR
jgi:glycine/D-amino acid oxidase-like deaminating enzyme